MVRFRFHGRWSDYLSFEACFLAATPPKQKFDFFFFFSSLVSPRGLVSLSPPPTFRLLLLLHSFLYFSLPLLLSLFFHIFLVPERSVYRW